MLAYTRPVLWDWKDKALPLYYEWWKAKNREKKLER
jgi:hypothetical protein